MNAFSSMRRTSQALRWSGAMSVRVLGLGWAASVPVVGAATIGVLASPHVRGLQFFPALRYAITTPACVLASVGAAFLYGALAERSARPSIRLAGALVGLAGVVLIAMAVAGPPGLAAAAWRALLLSAALLFVLIPRLMSRRLSGVGLVAVILFGVLEWAGVALALSSEHSTDRRPPGLAFDIPRAIFDVEHRFVTLPSGARIHYVDEGQGETLLFLHGNPSWSFQWRDLIRGLRSSHRCVALDYPGFGWSQASPGFGFTPREESLALEEFVDHLGLRGITLVMQDWGGPIGLGLAERRPELVRAVVLGSTWAWPTTTHEPRGKFSVIMGGPIGEFLQTNFNAFASLGIRNGILRQLSPRIADLYVRPFRPLDRRGIAAFYPGQITAATAYFAELEAGLPRLADKRALIFWAREDRGFPGSDRARFEKVFPQHQTIDLPAAGHFFFEDAADQMIPAIRAFSVPAIAPALGSSG
jgi:pimeloyl-ACP methyl ester carboxylesterase